MIMSAFQPLICETRLMNRETIVSRFEIYYHPSSSAFICDLKSFCKKELPHEH